MKTADVQTIAVERISSGYLAAAVRGLAGRGAAGGGGRVQGRRAVRRAARRPGVPEAARRLRGAARQRQRRTGWPGPSRRPRDPRRGARPGLGRAPAQRARRAPAGAGARPRTPAPGTSRSTCSTQRPGMTVLVATDEAAAAACGAALGGRRGRRAGRRLGRSPHMTASLRFPHGESPFSARRDGVFAVSKTRLAVMERETRPGAVGRRERDLDRAARRPGRRGRRRWSAARARACTGWWRSASRVPRRVRGQHGRVRAPPSTSRQARIEAPLRALPADAAGGRGGGGRRGWPRAAVLAATEHAAGARRGPRGLHRAGRRGRRALLGRRRGRRRLLLRRRARQLPRAARPRRGGRRRVRRCWASLYTARAVAYRGGRRRGARWPSSCSRWSPARAAGVFMTLNPANGDRVHGGLRGRLGAGRAAGLRRGDARPVRRGQGQRRGACAARSPTSRPGWSAPSRRHRRRGRPPTLRDAPLPTDAELAELLRIGRAVETRGRLPAGRRVRRRRRRRRACCRPARRRSGRAARPAPSPAAGTALDAVLATLTGRHPRPPRIARRQETAMATDRFPSPFDIETPAGAEGWESMYDWYHLFGPERRELDEQRFWFADRLHHPDVLHPYDEIQCECWWQALGAFNTRIFAMPPALRRRPADPQRAALRHPGARAAGATSPPAPRSSASAPGHYYERWDAIYAEWKEKVIAAAGRDPGAALRPAARPRAGVHGLRARRDTRRASG